MGLDAGELEALQGAMGTGDQSEVLGRLVSRVATLEAAAGEAEAQRRALHNQLVELRGNVMLLSCFLIYSVMIGPIYTYYHYNTRDQSFTDAKTFSSRRHQTDALPPRGVGSCNAAVLLHALPCLAASAVPTCHL